MRHVPTFCIRCGNRKFRMVAMAIYQCRKCGCGLVSPMYRAKVLGASMEAMGRHRDAGVLILDTCASKGDKS